MFYESEFVGYDRQVKGIEFTKLMLVQVPSRTFLMKMVRGKQYFLLQSHKTVIGNLFTGNGDSDDRHIVIMLEAAENAGVKLDKNNHNLSVTYMIGLVAMLLFLVFT